jgi:plasmid stabilization system protein ParE
MRDRVGYFSQASITKYDDEIAEKGEALGGIAVYKKGRVRGTREYAFSADHIIVYRLVENDAVEILTVVSTAMSWVKSRAGKVKAAIKKSEFK